MNEGEEKEERKRGKKHRREREMCVCVCVCVCACACGCVESKSVFVGDAHGAIHVLKIESNRLVCIASLYRHTGGSN